MSDHFTYQQRCLIQAIKHTAHGLGCAALGDFKGAAAHGRACTAWASLAALALSMVTTGTPQWLLDATWVEPLDYLDGMPDEVEADDDQN